MKELTKNTSYKNIEIGDTIFGYEVTNILPGYGVGQSSESYIIFTKIPEETKESFFSKLNPFKPKKLPESFTIGFYTYEHDDIGFYIDTNLRKQFKNNPTFLKLLDTQEQNGGKTRKQKKSKKSKKTRKH